MKLRIYNMIIPLVASVSKEEGHEIFVGYPTAFEGFLSVLSHSYAWVLSQNNISE